ncbi:unnamed protein product [Pleuronectes platessa]|uniref:Uncharacterized protein n=1 Tax=Pleuronectes platessa TaxID=8262 RepID=A0A9N7Z4G3_PLEPL|nr:unnamed protein product [Pleuronectes platessa]
MPRSPLQSLICPCAPSLRLLPPSVSLPALPTPPSHPPSGLTDVEADAPGPQKSVSDIKRGLMNGSRLFVCPSPSSAAAQARPDGTNLKSLPVPLLSAELRRKPGALHVCVLRSKANELIRKQGPTQTQTK